MGKMKRVGGCRRKEGIIETSFYLSPSLSLSLSVIKISRIPGKLESSMKTRE